MKNLIIYFYIISFSLWSLGEAMINCHPKNPDMLMSGPKNISSVCKEAKQSARMCCYDSEKCSTHIVKKIGLEISAIGQQIAGHWSQFQGGAMGKQYEACNASNIGSLLGLTGDIFKQLDTDKCEESIEECTATCDSEYKKFLIDFILVFTTKQCAREPGTECLNLNRVDLEEAKKNPENLANIEIKFLNDFTDQIVQSCTTQHSTIQDSTILKINKEYQTSSNQPFFTGQGLFRGKPDDFVKCDRIPKDINHSIQQMQLQACQKAGSLLGPSGSRAPKPVGSVPPPPTGAGASHLAANTSDPPGIETGGDVGGDPTSILEDDFNFEGPPSKGPNSGFGQLAGNQGAGGGVGGGSSGDSGAGTQNRNPNAGLNFAVEESDSYTTDPASFGSRNNRRNNRRDDNEDFGGFSKDSESDSDTKSTLADARPIDLQKYKFQHRSKTIFQMASYRIQKYCSEKIKHQCL